MPVPTSLATLSQTPASNSPAGSDAVFPQLDDYLREMFADFARLRDGANSWLTGVSGVDTITASCTSINALVAGQVFRFVAAGANTTAVTLNINGLGAKAVTRPGAVALVAGDMPTFAEVGYNGATFELLNSKHVALADAATSATSATTAGSASAVPWSGVSGTPTTVAGYGIVDAFSTGSLASAGTTQTGSSTTTAVTPAGLAATMLGGVGQAHQDVTASRAFGSTYTNSTGRPIVISVSGQTTSSTTSLTGVVGGVTICQQGTSFTGITLSMTFAVPNGATYSVSAVNNSLTIWSELR